MQSIDFSTSILVNHTAKEVFDAILKVRDWWSNDIEGSTDQLNDEFVYRAGNIHLSTQKIIELIPDQKVVWLITSSHLGFIHDKNEWTGTSVYFDINEINEQTQLKFTHKGLVPRIECYEACSNAWHRIIHESLASLITTGVGKQLF